MRGATMELWKGAVTSLCLAVGAWASAPAHAADAVIDFDRASPQMMFAVEDIGSALRERNYHVAQRGQHVPAGHSFTGGVLVRFVRLGGREALTVKPEG